MHSMRFIGLGLRSLTGGLLVCCMGAGQAAVIDDLYTATVERRTDVTDERATAQSDAMAAVLVRVTGSRAALGAPELRHLIDSPARYVASFGNLSATEAMVSFLPGALEQELTAAGWPLWGAERPLSMLWIAVTDQFGERAILSAGQLHEDAEYSESMIALLARIREEIEDVAELRGLPYILPSFTNHEDVLLSFDDVWSYSFGNLELVSDAYDADAMVIARVRESVIGTDVEWLVRAGSLRTSYPGAGVADGIHWLADIFAQEYSSVGGERVVTLRVSGVRDFDTYARVLAYLESVSVLSEVNVASFRGSELLLNVVSRGDPDVLSRTFGLDDVLRERTPSFGSQPLRTGNTLELTVVPERPSVFAPTPLR